MLEIEDARGMTLTLVGYIIKDVRLESLRYEQAGKSAILWMSFTRTSGRWQCFICYVELRRALKTAEKYLHLVICVETLWSKL